MTPIEDDPNLTTYVLGELPPDEAAEVEARLLTSDEGQALLEELRATAAMLDDGLAAELQRLSGLGTRRMTQVLSDPRQRRVGWWGKGIVAAAACLAAGAIGLLAASQFTTQRGAAPPIIARPGTDAPAPVPVTRTEQRDAGDAGLVELVLFPSPGESANAQTLGSALALLGIDTEHRTAFLDDPSSGREVEAGPSAIDTTPFPTAFTGSPAGDDRPLGKTPFSFDPS